MCCLQESGDKEVSGEELHDILKEIDTNMNGQVELDEYLQVWTAIFLFSSSFSFAVHRLLACVHVLIGSSIWHWNVEGSLQHG